MVKTKAIKVEKKGACVAKSKAVVKEVEPQGKQLCNQFAFKLKTAPKMWRDFYENNMKSLKASMSPEKEEFMRMVAKGDFNANYFKQMEAVSHKTVSKNDEQWMSYKKVVDIHGAEVVAVMVACGYMQTRLHNKLDPNHPSYSALKEEDKLQYKEETNVSSTIDEHNNEVARSSENLPEDKDAPEEEVEIRDSLAKMRNVHNKYQSSSIEFKIKLGKFENNKYVEALFVEATAESKLIKKNDAKVVAFLEQVEKNKQKKGEDEPTELDVNALREVAKVADDLGESIKNHLKKLRSMDMIIRKTSSA